MKNTIEEYTDYNAWGVPTVKQSGTVTNPPAYTPLPADQDPFSWNLLQSNGKIYDFASDLYYFHGRTFIDPSIGQFLQASPLTTSIGFFSDNAALQNNPQNAGESVADPEAGDGDLASGSSTETYYGDGYTIYPPDFQGPMGPTDFRSGDDEGLWDSCEKRCKDKYGDSTEMYRCMKRCHDSNGLILGPPSAVDIEKAKPQLPAPPDPNDMPVGYIGVEFWEWFIFFGGEVDIGILYDREGNWVLVFGSGLGLGPGCGWGGAGLEFGDGTGTIEDPLGSGSETEIDTLCGGGGMSFGERSILDGEPAAKMIKCGLPGLGSSGGARASMEATKTRKLAKIK